MGEQSRGRLPDWPQTRAAPVPRRGRGRVASLAGLRSRVGGYGCTSAGQSSAEGKNQLAGALHRARLYLEAGADCIYPILLADEAAIAELVAAAGTINITVRRGAPLSLERAASLGVRRVSYATGVFREATAAVQQIVTDIHEEAARLSG